MNSVGQFDESELQAYLDGRLEADRAKVASAYLDQYPADAARIADYAAQRDALRAALQFKFDEPVPQRLSVARIRADQRRRQTRRVMALAATVMIAIGGVAASFVASPYFGGGQESLVAEAVAARNGGTSPERSVESALLATSSARDEIVRDVLDVPAKVPDLGKAGYVLTDMKVYSSHASGGGRERALQIAYRNAHGRSFTLYMHKSLGRDRFDLEHRGDTQICIWQNEDLSVVMVGEMPAKEMLKVATLTYGDLNF